MKGKITDMNVRFTNSRNRMHRCNGGNIISILKVIYECNIHINKGDTKNKCK